jgi:hypothetical protein
VKELFLGETRYSVGDYVYVEQRYGSHRYSSILLPFINESNSDQIGCRQLDFNQKTKTNKLNKK